jgi:hypothetical protein
MKKTVKVLLMLVLVNQVSAQNPGYFGKKNVVDFSLNLQNPTFGNLRIAGRKDATFLALNGSNLVSKKDRLDWGFRFNYSRPLKRNFAIGLEFGYDYFSVQRESRREYYGNNNYYFENVDVNSLSIMPKFEFSSDGGLLPMGISHQLGFGVRLIKPVDKEYTVAVSEEYLLYSSSINIPIEPEYTSVLKYNGPSIKGYILMYALNFRSPLTKSLMLNYGIRYTLNFMSSTYINDYNVENLSDLVLDEAEFTDIVRYRKQFSLIQANIGLSFAF